MPPSSISKRILMELKTVPKEKDALAQEGISMLPDCDNPRKWRVELQGPKGSPYERGVFYVSIDLPRNFPIDPPTVRFLTPVYHMNIDSTGYICLDILQQSTDGTNGWSQIFSLSVVAKSILSLLTDPNPESPLDGEIADLYLNHRSQHDKLAWAHTLRYAMPPTKAFDRNNSQDNLQDGGNAQRKSDAREVIVLDD